MKRCYLTIYTLTLSILFTFGNHDVQAQTESPEKLVEEAVYYSNAGKHSLAVKLYAKAYALDSSAVALRAAYAHSLKATQNYNEAIPLFESLLNNYSHQDSVKHRSALADCYKHTEQYAQALRLFEELRLFYFNQNAEQNKTLLEWCNREISACEFALSYKDTLNAVVTALPSPVNTVYSEFNPVPLSGGRLYYSSYYPVFQDTLNSLFSDMFISEIFLAEQTGHSWQLQSKPGKKINNRKDHNGNISLSRNGNRMYFSRCEDIDGSPGPCKIYSAEKSGSNWTKVKALPESVNAPGSSSTHPFLVQARSHDILYFTSDRDGGFGGQDLWYVVYANGSYGEAHNLGSNINTVGNEITASYDRANEILYFSSDYHPGYGSYDIFRSTGGMNSWSQPVNMGKPVNSGMNDLYYVRHGFDEAYLSSNRKGSQHLPSAEYCCNDIYHVVYTPEESTPIPPPDTSITDTSLYTVEKQIQDLLPITLYFHNDIPDPKTTKTTTDKNYEDLLKAYVGMKGIYAEAYAEGLNEQAADQARKDIDDFFSTYVNTGFDELNKLTGLLLNELDSGKHVRIVVRGYASPLNNSQYNYNLSKRRIASLINYLKIYENGVFVPYLNQEAKNGGSLTIYEDPQGDSQAAAFVSDNPNDKRNSVYSRGAALERRIQIVRYQSGNNNDAPDDFPVLTLATDTIRIDSVGQNENKTMIIELRNDGRAEMKIHSVSHEAPSLTHQLESTVIPPGGKTNLYVLIRGKNRDGRKELVLHIKTNTPSPDRDITILIGKS